MTRLHRLRAKILLSTIALIALSGIFVVGATTFSLWPTANTSMGPPIAPIDPARAVSTAWQRAQARGGYNFSADVLQVTVPEATLTNVGRRSSQEQVYLEGQADLRRQSLALKVWSGSLANGGSVLVPESGLEVQFEDGKTRTRRGEGPWTEGADVTNGYAPQGDFLAYLAAMRDVMLVGNETRHDLAYTRYAFQIDGPAFARYSRDQMQQAMRARGELPAGVQLELSSYHAAMTGDGELWVGADGLPLRQILRLRFPVVRDEQLSAQIAVNFYDYVEQTPVTMTLLTDPAALGALVAPYLLGSLITLIGLASVLLFVFYRRRRVVEIGVAVSMSLLLVLTPLLTNLPLLRFLNTQRAQAAAQAATQAEVDVARSLRAIASESTFDPHANRLAALDNQAADSATAGQESVLAQVEPALPTAPECLNIGGANDPDADGLTTAEEAALIPPTNPNVYDSDGDGINDCLEARVWFTNPTLAHSDSDTINDFQEIGLGTDPNNADTDSDGLNDRAEIDGFVLAGDATGRRWHTDPLQPDTNKDGLADLIERGADPGVARDTDGDGTPDLYDMDNDGDGVPDQVDLSPFTKSTIAYGLTTDTPFLLTLNGIEPGKTAFLDLQLRPQQEEHLRYVYNVLDWPADRKGQVQDWDEQTFAQNLVAREYIASTAEAAAADSDGDMRLKPNLEIFVPGTGGADLAQYHLPPAAELAIYGISVLTATADGTALGAPTGIQLYVPLTLVTDPSTGVREAFRARLPYLGTGAAWTAPHQMRMVWTVETLLDIPCDPTDSEAAAVGCVTADGSNVYLFDLPASEAAALDGETLSNGIRAGFATAGRALSPDAAITALTSGSHWQIRDETQVYLLRLQAGVIKVYTATPGLFYNRTQIVQRYEDDWVLTGANVTEDHGVELGIFYEDPAVDPNLHSDDMLWPLAYGLDEVFLAPTDANSDGHADVGVDQLVSRFDRIANGGGAPSDYNWGIFNGLRVARLAFTSQDWAVAATAMTETQQLLTTFDNRGPITPTLLYAQKASHRAIGLDDLQAPGGSPYVVLSGAALAINLAPTPQTALQTDVIHSVKWSTFCVQPGAAVGARRWAACDQEEVGYAMEQRYRPQMEAAHPQEPLAVIDGRLITMRIYYLSLWNGASSMVRANGQMIINYIPPADSELRGKLTDATAGNGQTLAAFAGDALINKFFFNVERTLKTIGESRLSILAKSKDFRAGNQLLRDLAGEGEDAFSSIKSGGQWGAKGATVLLLGGAVFGVLAGLVWPNNDGVQIASASINLVNGVIGLYQPIKSAAAWAKVAGWGSVLKGNASFAGATARGAAIGAAVAIVLVWGIFIGTMLDSGAKFGSPAFNAALAGVIAMTIYLVVLAILSATVVGLILVALLGLIDAFFSLLCALDSSSKKALGNGGDDCTVGTKIVTALTGYLYARDMIVEVDAEKNPDLVQQGAPIVTLQTPALGYITKNRIDFSVPVTTNIVHKNPDNWNVMFDIPSYYDVTEFRSTTFRYTLSQQKAAFEVDRFAMSGAWTGFTVEEARDFGVPWAKLRAYAYQQPSMNIKLAKGINQPIDYWFNMAYALPAYECWTAIYVPVCKLQTERGGEPSFVNGPSYDIFPDTVGEFFTLTGSAAGRRLAWDDRFPTLWDADGDGLVSGARGGIDPDDNNPDTDADGLSDRFELQQRMAGVRLSPDDPDADSDGLFDAQEIQYGTNPANADTDNDGLTDAEEVYHQVFELVGNKVQPKRDITGTLIFTGGWQIVAPLAGAFVTSTNAIPVWVSSDPTRGDPDGDGIPDDAERRLYELYKLDRNGQPYHPLVANVNPLQLAASASVPPGGYLRPGDSFVYTNTLTSYANLDQGVLEVNLPSVLGGATDLTTFDLVQNQSRDVIRTYQIDPAAPSQPFNIASSARARLQSPNRTTTYDFNVSDGANRGEVNPPLYARAVSGDSLRLDRPDSYMLSGMLSHWSVRGSKGNIEAYNLGGGATPLDADTNNAQNPFEPATGFGADNQYRRGTAAPGIACNDSGNCFVVWDQVDNCNTFTVYRLDVDRNKSDGSNAVGTDRGIEPVLYYYRDLTAAGGYVLWSADQYHNDDGEGMEAGNWAGGALGAAPHRGLPVSREFCNTYDTATGSAAIYAMESNGDYSAGQKDNGNLLGFGAPIYTTIRPDQMENRVVTLGNYSGSNDVIRVHIDVPQKQRNKIFWSPATTSIQTQLTENLGASGVNVGDFNPVVAFSGDGYLVAWNRKVATYSDPNWIIQSKMMIRRFEQNDGIPTTPSTEIWSTAYVVDGSADLTTYGFVNYDAAFAKTETDLIPNVIWAGDRYRVVWALPASPSVNIYYRDLNSAGAPIGNTGALLNASPAMPGYDRSNRPALAYDPINHRILLAFHSTSDKIAGILNSLSSNFTTLLPELTVKHATVTPRISVAYYPAIQGWLLTSSTISSYLNYAALRADGSALNTPIPVQWPAGQTLQPSGHSLTCPAPESAPVVALPFEEMPGAVTYSDISGYATSDAGCVGNNCPQAGVAGVGVPNAPVANAQARPPRTDRALLFDGINDNVRFTAPVNNGFTYSFWFKPDPTQVHPNTANWWEGTPLLLANGNSFEALYGVALGAGNVILVGQGSSTAVSQPIPAADWDKWHHVVIVRRARNGSVVLYLDGVGRTGTQNITAPVNSPEVLLGKYNERYYRGALDFVTVYKTDMAADAVASLYKGELQSDLGYSLNPSYCVLASAAYDAQDNSGFPWTKIAIQRTLPRGESPLTAQERLSFRVDGAAPTSTIDSFAAMTYIQGPPQTQAGLTEATLIIGGSATDADSGISHVDVSVNGVIYPATGQATWTFPFVYGAEGLYTIRSRATDNVGFVESAGPVIGIIVDSSPPVATLAGRAQIAQRSAGGRWSFVVDGQIGDPASGGANGSGVAPASLRVIVQMADGTEIVEQPASVVGSAWSALVELPSATENPAGVYTVTLQAADNVGNQGQVQASVRLAASKVTSALDPASQVLDLITGATAAESARLTSQTPTFTGQITSSLGIAAVEAAFVPIQATSVLSDVVMMLNLDEPAGAVWFEDATLNRLAARCDEYRDCPVAGEGGRRDGALRFNGTAAIGTAHSPAIDFDATESFTLMTWVNATAGSYALIMTKYGANASYLLGLDDAGQVYLAVNGRQILTSQGGIWGAGWVHVAVTVDRQGESILYLNGTEAAYDPQGAFTESLANDSGLDIGYGFEGWLDDIIIVNHSLTAAEVKTVMGMADQIWHPAAFTATSGGATAQSEIAGTWSLPTPAGLENLYQLDLRVTDSTGKRLRRNNLWRGTIDNVAPHITVHAAATGRFYNDPATHTPRYEIAFTDIIAEDLHLATLTTPCGANAPLTRRYVDEAWNQRFFPDATLANRLTTQCHLWAEGAEPVFAVTACDEYGQCATASQPVSTASVARQADNTADPVLIWPPAGSVVAIDGALTLQMGATSAGPLKEMGVMVNGNAAEMVAFTQEQGITQTVATVDFNLPAAGEGVYNLAVQTTAWDGTVIVGPSSQIVLDTAAPQGSLITERITTADAYSARNGIMRFRGSAGDSLGNGNVANVELSIDGGPFQDVTWNGNGTWQTAAYVGANPYGKTYTVTMRTTDKAGRVMTDTKQVLVDISPPPGFDAARIPTLAVGDVTVNEDAGASNFVISLSAVQGYGTVAVNYVTVAGSALAEEDYRTTEGVAFIRAGQGSVVVSVPILDNTLQEPNKTFALILSAPVNATVADGQGVATIVDNDGSAPPTATPTPTAMATTVGAPPTATPTPTATATTVGAPPTATPTPMATVEGGMDAAIYLPIIVR